MKKLLIGTILVVLLTGVFRFVLGFYPWHLAAALDIATGLSAKLTCSGKFLSGQSLPQIIDDLASYSPATRLVELDDSQPFRIKADLHGLSTASATFRPGLGCTLDIGDTSALDDVEVPDFSVVQTPWPSGSATPFITSRVQQLTEQILERDNQQDLQTRALVVIKDGQLVAEAYAQGFDSQTPLLTWSVGKSLTSMLIGRFGTLNGWQDENMDSLFESWQDERALITLEQMLQMTSGLEFDETYAPGSDSTNMLFSEYSAAGVAMQSPQGHSPGDHFSYSSGTTNLLAKWLTEQLDGDPQESIRFMFEQLLVPAGMHNTTFEVDPSGVVVGSSYLYTTARDLARLGLLMLNDGWINNQQLLAPEWVARAEAMNDSTNDSRYGYQFWLNGEQGDLRWSKLPADAYMMMGNRKQYAMIVPSQNAIIVRLGWTSGRYPVQENFAELLSVL